MIDSSLQTPIPLSPSFQNLESKMGFLAYILNTRGRTIPPKITAIIRWALLYSRSDHFLYLVMVIYFGLTEAYSLLSVNSLVLQDDRNSFGNALF
jgi:hypothetical protein